MYLRAMPESPKHEKKERWKPLPLRREFWKKLPKSLNEGIVLIPEDSNEKDDIGHAAQAILIDYIEDALMKHFERPEIRAGEDFYEAFSATYVSTIQSLEMQAWQELSEKADKTLQENTGVDLHPREAAYLTLTSLERHEREAVSSVELYILLSLYAEVYETLLKEKYAEAYTPELFYSALRTNMPNFLLRFIALDGVIGGLLAFNAQTQESLDIMTGSGELFPPATKYESRMFYLDGDDTLKFKEVFVDTVHAFAKEKELTADQSGRTFDRGCPVLYAEKRDEILQFAIEELIAQHKLFHQKNETVSD